jgi:hypothetical protein
MVSRLAGAALVASSIVTASIAGAAPPATDVSGHSITCNTVTGGVKIKPVLDDIGVEQPDFKFKVKLAGCVDNTDPGVVIESGKISGTIAVVNNFCPDFITTFMSPFAAEGTLVYKWKASKDTPITPTESMQVIDDLTGDLFMPGGPFGSTEYIQFSFLPVSVTGAFAGTSSSNSFITSQDHDYYQVLCAGDGVKAFDFGLGTVTLD